MSALIFTVLLFLAFAAGCALFALAHRVFSNYLAQDVVGGVAAFIPLAALLVTASSCS